MSLLTIILFFVYTYGLGLGLTFFVKNSENFLERTLMRIGFGLGVFVVLGVVLNFLHIPLDWKIFLFLSFICPSFFIFKKIKSREFSFPKFRLTKENLNILAVLIIFFVCALMYIGGSFKYPYLEDDDPWEHAVGAKYVSIEKNLHDAKNYDLNYIDPYPPGYELLMGLLHQTSYSISWTLKFFNGLVISLGVIFFYFFAKLFIDDRNKALFAAFVLAAIPSFFTHFVWAHTLVIILFFPAMYCLEMIKKDKRWIYPSIILIASIFLAQADEPIKLAVMFFIYWLIKSITEKSWLKEILIAGAGGFTLSLVWWVFKWRDMFFARITSVGGDVQSSGSLITKLIAAFPYDGGTATRVYTINDFLYAQPFGGINVHFGLGLFVCILSAIGIISILINYKLLPKKENNWILITSFWFVFTFLGTNSMTFRLPIGLYAFRFWILLAIPVAILSSIGLWSLFDLGKKVKFPAIIIMLIAVIGVTVTSGYQKYNQNHNAVWPPGVNWGSNEEIQGYIWMKENLPTNTKVFGLCSNESSSHVIGFDMLDEPWKDSAVNFKKDILNNTAKSVSSFLKNEDYEYFVVDTRCVNYFGVNETNNFITNMAYSSIFGLAHQTQGMILFKVI